MGSYATCWLGNLFVGTTKNSVDPGIMALFRESDKVIVSIKGSGIPAQLSYWVENSEDADGESEDLVYYATPISVVRDRLEIAGYSLQTACALFELSVRAEIERCESQLLYYSDSEIEKSANGLQEMYEEDIAILSMMTAEKWTSAIHEIRRLGLNPNAFGRFKESHSDPLVAYMLRRDWYGLPSWDSSIALRLAIEGCGDGDMLLYDISDLIWGGYFDKNEDLIEEITGSPVVEFRSKSRIIILTEGKSDTWIIRESLSLLYPHLADYYSFMEYDAARVSGGAGNLAMMVKAFAGAGIVNRTIALFDNDTAASTALKGLEKVELPLHIKVLRLPEIEFLRNYPTLGPSGVASMDINGKAAGIELYLGEDVLRDSDGALTPIQWTGFEQGLKQYQGEILNKDQIQEKFRLKVEATKADPASLLDSEWAHMRDVLSCIFTAFQPPDGDRLELWMREHYWEGRLPDY